jgi:hypothetical protein
VSIIWGLKDRWLDFRDVEDFAKLASARLVQLPEVSCLSHSLPCIVSLLLLEGHRGDLSVYAWSLVNSVLFDLREILSWYHDWWG